MNCPHCNTYIDEHPASRCLDAWVAEAVIGRVVPDIDFCGRREYALIVERDGIEPLPNYSTSIAAAWQVVEKLAENNVLLHLARRRWGYMQWKAYFIHADFVGLPDAGFRDEADTAPLAICRAAIKAVQ